MTADLVTRLAALTPEQRALLRERIPQVTGGQGHLTPGQLRLWETRRWVADRPVDVVCQVVRLTGAPADLDLLADRVLGFVQAHEALRTTFESDGDETGATGDGTGGGTVAGVRPVVHPQLPPRVVRTRCVGADEAHALARELAAEPFDLANGPLLRVGLAEGTAAGGAQAGGAADEAWLLVVVHNLVFDAWSFELLLDELARPADTELRPPRPPSAASRANNCAGWRVRRAGRPPRTGNPRSPTPLRHCPPTGRAAPVPDGGAPGWSSHCPARSPTGSPPRPSARRPPRTPDGWPSPGPRSPSTEAATTCCSARSRRAGTGPAPPISSAISSMCCRCGCATCGDGSHAARTRAARTATRAGLAHASYPGELIAERRRVPGTHPLLDAVFVFDNLGEGGREIQGARAVTDDLDKGTARYDLTLALYPGPDGAQGWLEYDTELYDEPTVRRIAERFTALAGEAAEPGNAGNAGNAGKAGEATEGGHG